MLAKKQKICYYYSTNKRKRKQIILFKKNLKKYLQTLKPMLIYKYKRGTKQSQLKRR